MEKYTVIIFKNKIKQKKLKSFKTYKRAKNYFDELLSISNNVFFEKKTINDTDANFELALIEKSNENLFTQFSKDELGRNIKIELNEPGYVITNIAYYKIEELIYDIKEKRKLTFKEFVKDYLPKTGLKLVSKINHKIVVQNDNQCNLFSLKNESEATRFIEALQDYSYKRYRSDIICVSNHTKEQKKYLYNLLFEMGYKKDVLYRKFTSYQKKK